MAIVDVHNELNDFYDHFVCIGKEQRQRLEAARDASLNRLSRGIEELGDDRGQTFQTFANYIEQGSFAMDTLNQHRDNESDIDVAVIFRREDLPTTARAARKRVADALLFAGGGFARSPEARTNAVTVWYADGAHVDFAIYRQSGTTLEHAGPNWQELDPTAVRDWFNSKVEALSPEFLTTVRKHQFRRIVRWVKMFARSRRQWDLPGGMILSALLAETYQLHRKRDDIALYETLQATLTRLRRTLAVISPVNGSEDLTRKPTRLAQMKDLEEVLHDALEDLAVVSKPNCSRKKALRAWGTFFNHEFWRQAAIDEPRQPRT